MIIVVDESVSYGIVPLLREAGHKVVAIAESATTGIGDEQVFHLVQERGALLITRDYHFTNAIRFPASATRGILYIRRGNLTAAEEITLIQRILAQHSTDTFIGKLVTLYKDGIKIR